MYKYAIFIDRLDDSGNIVELKSLVSDSTELLTVIDEYLSKSNVLRIRIGDIVKLFEFSDKVIRSSDDEK